MACHAQRKWTLLEVQGQQAPQSRQPRHCLVCQLLLTKVNESKMGSKAIEPAAPQDILEKHSTNQPCQKHEEHQGWLVLHFAQLAQKPSCLTSLLPAAMADALQSVHRFLATLDGSIRDG